MIRYIRPAFLGLSLIYLPVSFAENFYQPDNANMQQMMQQMQQMQHCLQQVDEISMQDYEAALNQAHSALNRLCANGQSAEAESRAEQFRQNIAAHPDFSQIRRCSEPMEANAYMPTPVLWQTPPRYPASVCERLK